MSVKEVPVSGQDVSHLLNKISFVDRYEVGPLNKTELIEIYWNIFFFTPGWIELLMNLRNRLVSFVGLKGVTASELKAEQRKPLPKQVAVGQKIGAFTLFSSDENEMIMGENDRHLDFRISVKRASPSSVYVTTAVNTHNGLGRIYMALIKPFHKIIARSMISRAFKAGRL